MSSTFLRGPVAKRTIALIGVGALTIGTFSAVVAPAHAAPVRADLSATCEGLEDSPFTDIAGRTQEAQDAIGCLFNYDITQGRSADQYAPADTVSRQEMAIFISRQVQYVVDNSAVNYVGPPPASTYSDRDQLTVEGRAAVDLLTDLGVVTGNADGTYDGERAITRAEMAVFIDRVQDVVADQAGEDARYNPEDADATFDDIDGDEFFADAVLSLQSVGIVQGTGNDNYSPQAPVIRADMAFFIMRHLDENIVEGRVDSLVGPDSNESFTFGPDAAETLELDRDADDDSDERSFAAMDLDDDLTYRVTLVEADLVDVDEDGFVTFTNDEGTASDFAAVGDAADIASIASISNGDLDDVNSNTATAEPVDGTILVTIEGNEDAGSVIPVVYVNGAAGNEPEEGGVSPRLELDEDGVPVEPFGIAGQTTFTNPEAESGFFGFEEGDDGTVEGVDKDGNTIDLANGNLYAYDANDRYFIGGETLADQVSQAEFEAELSVGDYLYGEYSANSDFESRFVLIDVTPEPITIEEADASDSTVTITVTDLTEDATVTVYGTEDDSVVDTDDSVLATATTDEDDDIDGFQVVVEGLDADQAYNLAATQTVEAEESEISDTITVVTNETEVNPVIESAILADDNVVEGLVDTGDVIELTFDRDDLVVEDGAYINATDADGDTVRIQYSFDGDETDGVTDASFDVSLDDEADDDETILYVTLVEDAEDRNAAGGDVPGEGTIEFPLTLTSFNGIEDSTGGEINLADSDLVVGDGVDEN